MESSNETLKRYYNKKKKRRQRRKYVFYTILTVFFVLLITILSLTVFFNINDIAVTGNEYYTNGQIIEASGLSEGQNLFRLNKFRIIDKMLEKMPYLSQVSIDRHLPVGIEIIVTESKPYIYAEADGANYLLDENLKVLERVDTAPENLPFVSGIDTASFVIGESVSDEEGICTRLVNLTTALKKHIGDDRVTAIDVSTSYEVTFEYQGKIKVIVGSVENIEHKLELVNYVIKDNRSNERAEIDVSSGIRAYYHVVDERETQEDDTVAETEKDSTKDGGTDKDTEKDTEKEPEKESEDEKNKEND